MSKIFRRIALLAYFCAFAVRVVWPVTPAVRITQYGHTAWRVQDGVLSAAPTNIVQSNDGYLWIGTETGLFRFDGIRFVPWNSPLVADPAVTALLAATDGTVWVGTPSELVSWKDGKLTRFKVSGHTNAIVEDRQGRIWIALSRRADHHPVCEVSKGDVKCYGASEGVPFPFGGAAALDADGNLLVASASDVIHWGPERGLISSYHFEPLNGAGNLHGISAVQTDSDGTSLISMGFAGKGLGLQRWSTDKPITFTAPGLDGSTIAPQVTYRDRAGSLWIGTYSDGFYRITPQGTEHFAAKDGLSGDSVREFREDREGNLWVATDQGLDCFRNLNVTSWASHEGMPSGFVSSVLAAHDGRVLIGTHSGLNILHDGHVSILSQKEGLPAQGVTALAEDRSGRDWMGVGNLLVVYDGQKFSVVNRADGQPAGVVVAIASDGNGSVWASTIGPEPGLLRITDGKVESPLPEVTKAIALASDGGKGIWIHERTRVGHFSDGNLQWFPFKLRTGAALSITSSPDGAVFSSSPDGIWTEKDGKTQVMSTANGLPCQSANGLIVSKAGELVARTSCGLIVISPAALSAWWANPNLRLPYRLIDGFDGARVSYATFPPQMSSASDGRIWIANQAGIQVFDPADIGTNPVPPPVHIEGLIVDRQRLDPSPGLRLPPLTRDIEIQYTALSFVVPQKVRFRYKLEGRDHDWQEAGTRRSAFFQDLKPGNYRFTVLACNDSGLWNEVGSSFAFVVAPAWFQTSWFFLACLLVAAVLLYGMYRLRVRQVRRRLQMQFETRIEERTRVARDLHDTLLQTIQGTKLVAEEALQGSDDVNQLHGVVTKIHEWLSRAVLEGRAALTALRSHSSANDLADRLRDAATKCSEEQGMTLQFRVDGTPVVLSPDFTEEIYRIAYEAIRNACSHSQGSLLEIQLVYGRMFKLLIKDDGIGFDGDTSGRALGHYGLDGMRERAGKLGGSLTVKKGAQGGTEVVLTAKPHL